MARNGHLFTYIDPPAEVDGVVKSTTNCLEGGINAQIKALARNHRGMFDEHQRIAVDWWLLIHTQLPGDPVEIARQQNWGQDGLAKVPDLIQQEQPHDHDGRPATYDTGIDATPNTSIGIRQGWAGRFNWPLEHGFGSTWGKYTFFLLTQKRQMPRKRLFSWHLRKSA